MSKGISAARANELFCRVEDDDRAEALAEHIEIIQDACDIWNEANPEKIDGGERFVIGQRGWRFEHEYGIFDNKHGEWMPQYLIDFPDVKQ